MEQLVQFQMAGRGLQFTAVVADICLLPAVDLFMHLKVTNQSKGSTTDSHKVASPSYGLNHVSSGC